jgi:ferredoxin
LSEKKVSLTPDVFKVNDNGEVVISDAQLVDQIEKATDEMAAGEQGIKVSVSVSV